MPSRIIKESIIASETLAELTGDEERLFWRLIVLADDYGRYYGDPLLLRPQCFPRLVERIDQPTFDAWLRQLVESDLVQLYESRGKRYLQIVTWRAHQQQRAKASKFPDPPAQTGNGLHLISSDSKRERTHADVPVFGNGNGNESGSAAHTRACEVAASRDENPLLPEDQDCKDPVQIVVDAWHEQVGMLGPKDYDRLRWWIEEQGVDPGVVIEAITEAVQTLAPKGDAPGFGYVESILRRWVNSGAATITDAKRLRQRERNKASPRDNGVALIAQAIAEDEARGLSP